MRTFFDKIAGNEAARARIGKAITTGTLSHALMITGGEGSGKLLFAKEIAAALNCTNKSSSAHALPCGICNNCRRIRAEQFLDVHIFRKNEDKLSVGIEEIRHFLEDVSMFGAESDYRFYIFDNAEAMTNQTQNSLLKVLEEPPEGVYIILLCERPDSIVTTIKSRVQTIAMSRFSTSELDEFLSANSEDAKLLKRLDKDGYIAALDGSGGSIGIAMSMMNRSALEDIKAKNESARCFIKACSARAKYTELREVVSALPKKKGALEQTLEYICTGISDLISVGYDKKRERTVFKSEEEATALAREIGTERLLRLYDLIMEIKDGMSKNANTSVLITKLSAEMCRE